MVDGESIAVIQVQGGNEKLVRSGWIHSHLLQDG
jgi:hypothetical protein